MSVDAPARRSAIYEGRVRHRRRDEVGHAFSYRVFLVCLDLSELPALQEARGPLARSWLRPWRFRRADYLGPEALPLDQAVRDEVARHAGARPQGRILMLTSLRTLGYLFNPVTFYYCLRADGSLDGVLAEITNTPWGERHRYWSPAEGQGARLMARKRFHVSPFQPMEQSYRWSFSAPEEALSVAMQNLENGAVVFEADLVMRRRELTARELWRQQRRLPWITLKVIFAIHWNALLLWLKGATFYTHPKKRQAAT